MKKRRNQRFDEREYNLGNMKDYENQSATTKKADSKDYNSCCVWIKNRWWRSKTKKADSQNAYIYFRFCRVLMITRVEERWRSSRIWILARTCDKNEAPVILRQMTEYVIVGFPGATATFWKVPNRESERRRRHVTKMEVVGARQNRDTPSN